MTEEQRRAFSHAIGDEAMTRPAEEVRAEREKAARLRAEREAIEERVRENRERLAEEKRENAEIDFKSQCERVFFAENPHAERSDFLRLYPKIRDRMLIETVVIGLRNGNSSFLSDFQ